MQTPPYIRGLIDLFSTGRRVGLTLGIIGVSIILISAGASFVSYANNFEYSGPLITGNAGIYAGVFITLLAFFAFLGDVRYSAMQRREQEIESQQRLRSAEDKLANPVKTTTAEEREDEESAAQAQPRRCASTFSSVGADERTAFRVSSNCHNPGQEKLYKRSMGNSRWLPTSCWICRASLPHSLLSCCNCNRCAGGSVRGSNRIYRPNLHP
jgi:hypothetical protein